MKLLATAVLAVALAVTSAGTALAQGTTPRVVPPWDPKTVETFSGDVVTEQHTGNIADLYVIMVKAGGDLRTVTLGPKRMISPDLTKLAAKTAVDVTASKVLSNGTPIYLASVVKVGGKTYTLRDDKGKLVRAK